MLAATLALGAVTSEPSIDGIIGIHRIGTDDVRWLPGTSGKADVNGVAFTYETEAAPPAKDTISVTSVTLRWSVDKALNGDVVRARYCAEPGSGWRCTVYPFAGNASEVKIVRLMNGITSISLPQTDRIAAVLGLVLVKHPNKGDK
jgi:hypothetical protein